jgi:ketosteroid isomerase-like protein
MQTDLNANKAIARAFFERFDANDLDGVMALFADTATFQVPGKSDEMRSAGVYDKDRLRRLFDRMTSQLPAGLRMSVSLLVAEGDIVIAEATSRGELPDGRVYDQRYLNLFRIADGKIIEAREYNDTLHAHRVWIAPVINTAS